MNFEEELDQIYTKILSASVGETQEKGDNYGGDEDEFIFKVFRQVVGSIIALFNPLSTNAHWFTNRNVSFGNSAGGHRRDIESTRIRPGGLRK